MISDVKSQILVRVACLLNMVIRQMLATGNLPSAALGGAPDRRCRYVLRVSLTFRGSQLCSFRQVLQIFRVYALYQGNHWVLGSLLSAAALATVVAGVSVLCLCFESSLIAVFGVYSGHMRKVFRYDISRPLRMPSLELDAIL